MADLANAAPSTSATSSAPAGGVWSGGTVMRPAGKNVSPTRSFLAARIAAARRPPSVAWAMGRLGAAGAASPSAPSRGSSAAAGADRAVPQQVGMTPKTVARVLRFNHAIGLLGAGNGASWAALAQDCGYTTRPISAATFAPSPAARPAAISAAACPTAAAWSDDGAAARQR
jgi:hypothetical protein